MIPAMRAVAVVLLVATSLVVTRAQTGIPFADIARPRAGEWPTYHGQLSGNRHSPLTQINAANVAQLVAKWTFAVAPGSERALQVTPLVVDGTMYVTAPN